MTTYLPHTGVSPPRSPSPQHTRVVNMVDNDPTYEPIVGGHKSFSWEKELRERGLHATANEIGNSGDSYFEGPQGSPAPGSGSPRRDRVSASPQRTSFNGSLPRVSHAASTHVSSSVRHASPPQTYASPPQHFASSPRYASPAHHASPPPITSQPLVRVHPRAPSPVVHATSPVVHATSPMLRTTSPVTHQPIQCVPVQCVPVQCVPVHSVPVHSMPVQPVSVPVVPATPVPAPIHASPPPSYISSQSVSPHGTRVTTQVHTHTRSVSGTGSPSPMGAATMHGAVGRTDNDPTYEPIIGGHKSHSMEKELRERGLHASANEVAAQGDRYFEGPQGTPAPGSGSPRRDRVSQSPARY